MTSHRTLRRAATTILALACASAAPAIAGVRRDDRADSLHTALGNDPRYASVGSIIYGLNRGSGTLITPRWVLTAGHVVDSTTSRTFRYGGTAYNNGTAVTASQHFAHPSWTRMDITGGFDIGLVRLPTPITTITPASRFTGAELGMVGTSVGFGLSGTGSSGYNIFDFAGLKRAGTNTLDALGSAYGGNESDRLIAADFDAPFNDGRNHFGAAAPLDLEYCIASGDSGGGTFVEVAGRSYVAAVHSVVHAFPVDEDLTDGDQGGDETDNSNYSDTFASTRVTAFNEWIDDNVANHWANPSGGTFNTGGNWSQGAIVPASGDVASFNLSGTYAITLASNVMNHRLLARRGDVTLNLAGATYTLASTTYEGSLVVGKYAGNDARVMFAGGTMNSCDAVVGELAGSTGHVTVGSGATWNCATDIYVGGSFLGPGGAGTVRVNSGGTLAVAGTMKLYAGGTLNLAGGVAGAGTLRLSGGAIAGSGTFASPVSSEGGAANVASGTLTLGGPLTTAAGSTLTKNGAGTLVLAGSQSHGAGAALHVAAGAAQLTTDAGPNLSVNVDAGASALFSVTQHLSALDVAGAASASLAQHGSRLLAISSLEIESGGVLNLHDNDLLIHYDGGSIEHTIRAMVTDGRIAYDAGDGDVILAIADNTEWDAPDFHGESIDDTTIVGKYTYFGDANLDGAVTTDDYVAVDLGLGTGDSWVQGDVDVNGFVSTDDYVVVDLNLGKGTNTPLAWAEMQSEMIALHTEMFGAAYVERLAYAQEHGFASIPDPASLSGLALTSLLFARRRR